MGKRLKGFDFDKHTALGQELCEMRNRLLSVSIELSNAYGVTSKVSKRADRAYNAVDELRSILDDVVRRDCPGKTTLELNHLYYPGSGTTPESQ
jgi:hypothetical protein